MIRVSKMSTRISCVHGCRSIHRREDFTLHFSRKGPSSTRDAYSTSQIRESPAFEHFVESQTRSLMGNESSNLRIQDGLQPPSREARTYAAVQVLSITSRPSPGRFPIAISFCSERVGSPHFFAKILLDPSGFFASHLCHSRVFVVNALVTNAAMQLLRTTQPTDTSFSNSKPLFGIEHRTPHCRFSFRTRAFARVFSFRACSNVCRSWIERSPRLGRPFELSIVSHLSFEIRLMR